MHEHEFAIYFKDLKYINEKEDIFIINDADFLHRIVNVLRFDVGKNFIIFDEKSNYLVSILKILNKKYVELKIIWVKQNAKIRPNVTWALPILKRENLQEAIYSLVELGVTSIQLIQTAKSANLLNKEKELIRMHKIIIAACEQSKNFDIPILMPVLKLENWLDVTKNLKANRVFFDVSGNSILNLLEGDKNKNDFICCAGPEGDLTILEKENLKKSDFKFFKLTPTVLRAQQAIVVGLGIIRSIN